MLAPARSLDGGTDGVLEVFRRWGSVQFDPLAIAGRNHDLVLHARVADYAPAWSELLYERREIFEAYNKGLSLVLTSEYPWFRAPWGVKVPPVLAENAEVADHVLERIRAEGPLSALDFQRERGALVDWFGVPTNVVRAVLETYAVTGVLGLARREGNRRYYDLLERLLPADVLAHEVPLEEQMRHKLLSRYRTHGLLGIGGGGDIFGGLGPGEAGPQVAGHPGRTALRDELIEDGTLVRVTIEGARGKRFVLREEVALLEAPPEPPPSVAFLPPFDPLVWDRGLFSARYSTSSTSGISSSRPRSGGSAGTRCRSCSATASSGASSRESTGRPDGSRSSASGGRTASPRGESRGSSTRCATRFGRISHSQAPAASRGPRTSPPSGGCSRHDLKRPPSAGRAPRVVPPPGRRVEGGRGPARRGGVSYRPAAASSPGPSRANATS